MVSNFDTFTRSNLIFPLTWHDLSICARNFNTSIKTSFVMSISNSATKSNITTNRTVVRSLRSWMTTLRPSIRMNCKTIAFSKNSIFLFDTVPRFFTSSSLENWFSNCAEICNSRNQLLVSSIFPDISFSQYKDIVTTAERIWEVSDWLHDNLRVLSWCLIARRTIVIPVW